MSSQSCLRPRRLALAAGVLAGWLTAPAGAVTHLKRGDTPPAFTQTLLGGGSFELRQETGRPVLLLFGELYHPGSMAACKVVQEAAKDPRFGEQPPKAVLIVTQRGDPDELSAEAKRNGVSLPIVHDADRRVFAAYQVSVLPSVVALDREGKVVHAMAAMPPAFREIVTDALLCGGGKLSVEQLDRTLRQDAGPAVSESARQAARLTELADQLELRGLHDLATEKYREALAAEAGYVPARLGLGRAALQARRLAEAEASFREILTAQPKSLDALRGLAYVQTLRGGEELKPAEQRIRALLSEQPNDAEAHYILGLIQEQTGRVPDAAASFKRSAELAMARVGREG